MSAMLLRDFDFLQTVFTPFVGLSYFFALFCSFWFVYLFAYHRFLFIKPSIILLFCSHLFFQWPAAIYSGFTESYLPDPSVVPFLLNLYILIGLFISSYSFRARARVEWYRMVSETDNTHFSYWIRLVAASLFLGLLLYLIYVPFSQTGLYALIFDPSNSDAARDQSYNMLPSYMKYIYSIVQGTLAPLLAALTSIYAIESMKKRRYMHLWICLFLVGVCIFSVILTGARYPAAKVLIAILLAIIFKKGLPFAPVRIFTAVCLVLLPAALITLYREGNEANPFLVLWYLFDGIIFHRVFCVPYQVGLWHIQYSQFYGLFGIAAIPKLAVLFNIEPIIAPKVIGAFYLPHPEIETHSNVGYLFSYFSYFGFLSLPISIFLLFTLDFVLFIYKYLHPAFIAPCLGALFPSIMEFAQSDYLTILITHGYLLIPIVSLMVSVLSTRGILGILIGTRNVKSQPA